MEVKLSSLWQHDIDEDRPIEYEALLNEVQREVGNRYADTLQSVLEDSGAKEALYDIVYRHLVDNNSHIDGYTRDNLAEKMVNDMVGFGFLEELIYNDDVEEIRANSWDDVEVVFSGKPAQKWHTHFRDEDHIRIITRKMVRLGGKQIDATTPVVDSYFAKGTRITAMIPKIVDKEVGAAFVIRRQRRKKITREQFIAQNSASESEMRFLEMCVNCGVSLVFSGRTGSGKTTDLEYFLSVAAKTKRIITTEGERELNLPLRDENGNVITSVVHTSTRYNDDEKLMLDENDIFRHVLRFTPEVYSPAEMRGNEAFTAVQASLSGHTVVTTVHADSINRTILRIFSLCKYDPTCANINDNMLMQMITEAFPIIVYMHQFPDYSRKVADIVEVVGMENNKFITNSIFRYDPASDKHIKTGDISKPLAGQIFREKGGGGA